MIDEHIFRYKFRSDIPMEAKRNYLKGVYYKDKLDEDTLSPIFDNSNDYNNVDKMSDFIINSHFDYYYNNPDYIHLDADPQKVEVKAWEPIFLKTWYPIGHLSRDYSEGMKFGIGHSELDAGDRIITKYIDDDDYNLVTNNCSDTTREALETVFGKEAGVIGFTTPGDVRDFAIENGGVQLQPHARLISIPMDRNRWNRLKKYLNISNSLKFNVKKERK